MNFVILSRPFRQVSFRDTLWAVVFGQELHSSRETKPAKPQTIQSLEDTYLCHSQEPPEAKPPSNAVTRSAEYKSEPHPANSAQQRPLKKPQLRLPRLWSVAVRSGRIRRIAYPDDPQQMRTRLNTATLPTARFQAKGLSAQSHTNISSHHRRSPQQAVTLTGSDNSTCRSSRQSTQPNHGRQQHQQSL
jgi:hypothetical protein